MKYLKIVKIPPGERAKAIIEKSREVLVTTTRDYPIVISKAENDLIWDVDGNVYIDFVASIAVANVGHRNKEVLEAIRSQLDKYLHIAPHDFYDELQYKLAKKLVEITPGSFKKKVFFGNSGTEAVEAAIKIAKKATRRPRLIAFIGAFHGRTHGSLALTASKPVHQRGFFSTIPGVEHAPYAYCYRCPFKYKNPVECGLACIEYLEKYMLETYIPPDEVAAIFFEPVQGEGGYIVPPKEFIKELRRIADEHGILLIDDEIQAGFGRTGKMFAVEHFDVVPDVITMAKAIAAGLPLGATVIRADLDFDESGSHSSTFGGNALSLAAALANIEYIIKNNLSYRAAQLGEYALRFLNDLKEECDIIGDVRGMGLMIGIEIVKSKKSKEYAPRIRDKIVKKALEKGLIVLPAGRSTIRISPPLTIEKENLEKGLEILGDSIKKVYND